MAPAQTGSRQASLIRLLPQSSYARAFLLVTLLESSIDILLESIIIVRTDLIHSLSLSLDPSIARSPLAVYLLIFILAHLFQLYFAHDALRHKNTIQLIGLCAFNAAFLVYALIQVAEIRAIERSNGNPSTNSSLPAILLLLIPACIGISQIAFVYLSWHLFGEFGWQIYKQIGADRKIKRIFLMYQIFMCLLKFDFFFFIAFSLQLVLLVPSVGVLERVLTIIAVPATLVLLVVGYYALRTEAEAVMWAFQFGLLSGSSYFVYKLFRIWHGRNNPLSYQNVFKSLTVFSVSCLLMTLLTFTSALICLRNFGKGLRVHMARQTGQGHHPLGPDRRRAHQRLEDDEFGAEYHLSESASSLGTVLSGRPGEGIEPHKETDLADWPKVTSAVGGPQPNKVAGQDEWRGKVQMGPRDVKRMSID